MKLKKIFSLILVLSFILAFAGCGSPDTNNITSSDENTSSKIELPPPPVYYNPYTGEEGYLQENLYKRPLAVMINNIEQALPQRGISKADIIFELPVEGPITRMMAIFSDPESIPEVGSIRSARHDFVELVKPLNAIYLHFGGSSFAKQAIADLNIDDIEGLYLSNTAFYFDSERNNYKSSEHCWFSTADLLAAGIKKQGFNITQQTEVTPIFNFIKEDEVSKTESDMQSSEAQSSDTSSGEALSIKAYNVTVPQSSICTATFTYDEVQKTYKKGQYGDNHIDETTGEAISVKNVFLMYTDVSLMADGYHKEVDMSKGTGYYISNGVYKKVTFKKPNVDDMIKVYDEDGTELLVNPGQSYFCIIPNQYQQKLIIE